MFRKLTFVLLALVLVLTACGPTATPAPAASLTDGLGRAVTLAGPAQKIVSTGDLIVTNRADDNPNIHYEKDGSTEGWLKNVKGMIALNAETYVTGHGDLTAAAQGPAGYRGDDRLLDGPDPAEGRNMIVIFHFRRGFACHLLNIRTCGECLFTPCDNHGPDILLKVKGLQRIHDFVNQLFVQGIQCLGAIKSDEPNAAAYLCEDHFVAHGIQFPCV